MNINLVSVLREFAIVEKPTSVHDNHVFFCRAYDPVSDAFTDFSRFFENPNEPWTGSNIVMDGTQHIGSGEDPRPFYWRGSPCVSAQTFSTSHGFINKIYVKTLNKWFILIPPKNITAGKNWCPFVHDGDLYFVHEYSPFRVLKAAFLSEHDDFMVLNVVAKHDVPTPKAGDNYSQFRGGANALQFGDKIVGIGHRNQRLGKDSTDIVHRPFFFIYEPDVSLAYYAFDFDFPDTFKIVDPTSLYLKDGTLYLVTCETELAWDNVPQIGRSCLYEIDIEGLFDENGTGFGGRRLHWWPHGKTSKIRRLLGAWR